MAVFPSLRSRREHKAWGVSPSESTVFECRARGAGERSIDFPLPAVSRARENEAQFPGAHTPGCMLPPASQACTKIKVQLPIRI